MTDENDPMMAKMEKNLAAAAGVKKQETREELEAACVEALRELDTLDAEATALMAERDDKIKALKEETAAKVKAVWARKKDPDKRLRSAKGKLLTQEIKAKATTA